MQLSPEQTLVEIIDNQIWFEQYQGDLELEYAEGNSDGYELQMNESRHGELDTDLSLLVDEIVRGGDVETWEKKRKNVRTYH